MLSQNTYTKTMKKLQGHLALLGANIMWGLMAPLGKDLLNGGVIPPLTLAAMRIVCAAALFWACSLLTPASVIPKEKIALGDWGRLLMASLLVISGNQVLVILGLGLASPIDGAIVCSSTPIFCLVMSALIYATRVSWLQMVGVAMGFAGMLMFVFGSASDTAIHADNPMLGDSLCIVAQVCGALYLVLFTDLFQRYSPFTLMKWMFLFSAVLMAPLGIIGLDTIPWHEMTTAMWTELGYVILCATFLAYLLLPIGQKHVSPTTVAVYNYLQPVAAVVYSIVFGLAPMTAITMLASALIIMAVYVVSRK